MANMKRIVVLGGGESGVGAAILAQEKGFDVFLSDASPIKDKYKTLLQAHNIPFEEGKHSPEMILNADEVIKSPGIPLTAPLIVNLTEKGTPIISEIEFAGRYTNARMICITGSNGKTTTTLMTYHLLKSAGINVGLAGNVGKSLALQVAYEKHDYYVIELSSFQLDNMYQFHADIAILMNITPDHLDRYDHKMQNYIDAKMRILQNMTEQDSFIYWADDEIIKKEIAKRQALSVKQLPFADRGQKREEEIPLVAHAQNGKMLHNIAQSQLELSLEELPLPGPHNLYNTMAATLTAKLVGISDNEIIRGLNSFPGVEHRLEKVGTYLGVEYINDSKATNVDSCRYALMSMKRPTVLILGGKDKGNDYSLIYDLIKKHCKALVFMGLHNERLHEAFDKIGLPIADTHTLLDAMESCRKFANSGETVLLSPCCASFDLFKSYEDRGEQFKDMVKSWMGHGE